MACDPLAGIFCMLAFFSMARLMLSVACPGAFAWKVSVNTCPSPVMPVTSGRPRCCELQNPHHAVVAMDQRHRLAILLQHRSIRHVQQLQHFRVVENLQRNRVHVLPAGQIDVDGEGRSRPPDSATADRNSAVRCPPAPCRRLVRRRTAPAWAVRAWPACVAGGAGCGLPGRMVRCSEIALAVPTSIARVLLSKTSCARTMCGISMNTSSLSCRCLFSVEKK